MKKANECGACHSPLTEEELREGYQYCIDCSITMGTGGIARKMAEKIRKQEVVEVEINGMPKHLYKIVHWCGVVYALDYICVHPTNPSYHIYLDHETKDPVRIYEKLYSCYYLNRKDAYRAVAKKAEDMKEYAERKLKELE